VRWHNVACTPRHCLHRNSLSEQRFVTNAASQVGDILSNVFPSLQHRVDFKSFGHVVPQESVMRQTPCAVPVATLKRRFGLQVLGMVVSSGPNGHAFQFSFANRNSAQMLNDLSQALVVIAESVPDGVRSTDGPFCSLCLVII
jgi:hypothetical protein